MRHVHSHHTTSRLPIASAPSIILAGGGTTSKAVAWLSRWNMGSVAKGREKELFTRTCLGLADSVTPRPSRTRRAVRAVKGLLYPFGNSQGTGVILFARFASVTQLLQNAIRELPDFQVSRPRVGCDCPYQHCSWDIFPLCLKL